MFGVLPFLIYKWVVVRAATQQVGWLGMIEPTFLSSLFSSTCVTTGHQCFRGGKKGRAEGCTWCGDCAPHGVAKGCSCIPTLIHHQSAAEGRPCKWEPHCFLSRNRHRCPHFYLLLGRKRKKKGSVYIWFAPHTFRKRTKGVSGPPGTYPGPCAADGYASTRGFVGFNDFLLPGLCGAGASKTSQPWK